MTERKLVTIRRISELNPIPKADAIECAKIDGWNVVVRKGEFEVGDPCVFFEIDSVLPDIEPFRFLTEKQGKTFYNGKFGARLKTIRLRGQLSQGLALPIGMFHGDYATDEDLTETLGVWKYDPPPPAELAGKIAGSWPAWLPKTDQERIQNIDPSELTGEYAIEEKMDGTSMSVWIDEHGVLGVGSRNMSLKIDDPTNDQNSYVRMAHDSGMLNWLETHIFPQEAPIAIQGELCGPSIQGNPYNLDRPKFFVFDIFSGRGGGKLDWEKRDEMIERMQMGGVRISTVPFIRFIDLDKIEGDKVQNLLQEADGLSAVYNTAREGVVLKNTKDGNKSFKCVSNKYLEKQA